MTGCGFWCKCYCGNHFSSSGMSTLVLSNRQTTHFIHLGRRNKKKGVKVDTAIMDYPTRNNKINRIYYYVPRPNNQLFLSDTFCEIAYCVFPESPACALANSEWDFIKYGLPVFQNVRL